MLKRRIMRHFFPLLAVAALLNGCLLVDDFAGAWTQSKPDVCLSKIGESLYYSEFRRDPEGKDMSKHVHGLTLNGKYFLLLKKDEADKGGRMYRFGIVHGIFQRYRLNPTMRDTFKKDYPNAPVNLDRDTITLKKLDPETLKLLGEIAAKNDYWEIEDQTLYNPIRNTACIFEDRTPEELKE